MCTVIVRVPQAADEPVRVLAVRDEDPLRPWRPLGCWWPDAPDVRGVQDVRAGGAWLAARDGSLAVILNRHGDPDLPEAKIESRGRIVLDAIAGIEPAETARTRGFNLVSVRGSRVRVSSWDGATTRTAALAPGTHMIAHDDVDDPRTPRIRAWLPGFTAAPTTERADGWWVPWVQTLGASAEHRAATDDAAIIRDNAPHGVNTQSLLVCVASVTATQTDVRGAQLDTPGRWNPLHLV